MHWCVSYKRLSIRLKFTGPHCRGTWSLYETDIVFDPNGALIARYHKTHPWFTSLFDTPKPQLVTYVHPIESLPPPFWSLIDPSF